MNHIKKLGEVLPYKFPLLSHFFYLKLRKKGKKKKNPVGSMMVWLLILLVLKLSFCDVSEARHQKKLPSAVVVGTVFCDTCFQEKFSKSSHFISGATVAVECIKGESKPSFRAEVKTDRRGEFKVRLPVPVSKHVKKIEGCSVELIRSSEPYCGVAAAATSSSLLQLKSRKQGAHTFSAGFFTFKPLKQPNLCNQKPHSNTFDDMKQVLPPLDYPSLPSPIQNPTIPNVPRIYHNLPPLPFLPGLPPLPQLPPLPPLPAFPTYPPKRTAENETNGTSKESGKPDQFQPERPWKPHFVLPPHRLHNPFLRPSSIPPPLAAAAAGGSAPSPPPPSSSFPFPLPPVPGLSGIPSTSKQTSP